MHAMTSYARTPFKPIHQIYTFFSASHAALCDIYLPAVPAVHTRTHAVISRGPHARRHSGAHKRLIGAENHNINQLLTKCLRLFPPRVGRVCVCVRSACVRVRTVNARLVKMRNIFVRMIRAHTHLCDIYVTGLRITN